MKYPLFHHLLLDQHAEGTVSQEIEHANGRILDAVLCFQFLENIIHGKMINSFVIDETNTSFNNLCSFLL